MECQCVQDCGSRVEGRGHIAKKMRREKDSTRWEVPMYTAEAARMTRIKEIISNEHCCWPMRSARECIEGELRAFSWKIQHRFSNSHAAAVWRCVCEEFPWRARELDVRELHDRVHITRNSLWTAFNTMLGKRECEVRGREENATQ